MGSETAGYPAAMMKLHQLKEVKLPAMQTVPQLHLHPGNLSNWHNSKHMVIIPLKNPWLFSKLFPFVDNLDTLICGNCKEMFHNLSDIIDHKKHYCKLRFTCKCAPKISGSENDGRDSGMIIRGFNQMEPSILPRAVGTGGATVCWNGFLWGHFLGIKMQHWNKCLSSLL